jgi:hypothetical protein
VPISLHTIELFARENSVFLNTIKHSLRAFPGDAGFLEQLVQEIKMGGQQFLELAVPETVSSNSVRQNAGQAAILSQAVRELVADVPWGHHVELLKKVKDPAARLY